MNTLIKPPCVNKPQPPRREDFKLSNGKDVITDSGINLSDSGFEAANEQYARMLKGPDEYSKLYNNDPILSRLETSEEKAARANDAHKKRLEQLVAEGKARKLPNPDNDKRK